MIKSADTELEIKYIEKSLFYSLKKWNDEDYMNSIKYCDKVKLSKKIDSLKDQYSTAIIPKQTPEKYA